jgi:hypothetical protein
MRIAISGSHSTGKSTLIDEFLRTHTDFAHEPEPYVSLVEDYGEEFASEPCVDDFYRQLRYNLDRLGFYSQEKRVIYERCPADFLAYILALNDLGREKVDPGFVETVRGMALEAMASLDVIVFLPIDDVNSIEVDDSEDPRLRSAVDSRLVALLFADEFGFPGSVGPTIVEANGPTAQRLQLLEAAMRSHLQTH